MQDKWRKWMRRSDCIMGVTPDQGGSWLSSIRENSPQVSVAPAADGVSWAVGSGLLKPVGMETLFEFPAGVNCKCGTALDLRGSTNSFTIAVAIAAGAMQLTRMPYLPYSDAMERVNATVAPLAAV